MQLLREVAAESVHAEVAGDEYSRLIEKRGVTCRSHPTGSRRDSIELQTSVAAFAAVSLNPAREKPRWRKVRAGLIWR